LFRISSERLSIQYVYERVFLFFKLNLFQLLAYLSKRVQKYNFFLISQEIFKSFSRNFTSLSFSISYQIFYELRAIAGRKDNI